MLPPNIPNQRDSLDECIEMETFHNNSSIINLKVTGDIETAMNSSICFRNKISPMTESGNRSPLPRRLTPIPNLRSLKTSIAPSLAASPVRINNMKWNKNLISFIGMLVLTVYFIITLIGYMGSRTSLASEKDTWFMLIQMKCCAPVVLPIAYFTRNPKYLITVIRHIKG